MTWWRGDGHAGAPLLVALAQLWNVPLPASLDPPGWLRAELAATAAAVRTAGVLPGGPVPAGQVPLLRDRGVRQIAGWLIAVDDRASLLARPIRRQLAAAGPLRAAELLVGARRQRPRLADLDQVGLLTWARAQPDLTIDGEHIHLLHGDQQWLRATDPCVLALFTDRTGSVARADILTALGEVGTLPGSAEVWTVPCAWLRPAGTRGRYVLAGFTE